MSFIFKSLKSEQFSHLYGLSDEALKAHAVFACFADSPQGFPCRVTLQECRLNQRVLLLNYTHLNVSSPFHSSHAIYVADGVS